MVAFPRFCWFLPAVSHDYEVMLMTDPLYHEGNRELQDQFDWRRIADRLEKVTLHAPSRRGRGLHRARDMFFMATADAEGRPDVPTRADCPASSASSTTHAGHPRLRRQRHVQHLGNVLVNPTWAAVHRFRATRSGCASTAPPTSAPTIRCGANSRVRLSCASRPSESFRTARATSTDATRRALGLRAGAQARASREPDWKHMPVFKEAPAEERPGSVQGG